MAPQWTAPVEISAREKAILKLTKKQKIWAFLRRYRHALLDEDVRSRLYAMYDTDEEEGGRPPACPERLLLAMLLQVALGKPDHEVVTLTVVDSRWQMILDCMGASQPAFSQGTLFNFRERVRENGLMDLLLEKTVEMARASKEFSHKKLRAIFDSSPLAGAGRVEDTFNLLGRAIAQLLDCAAKEGSFCAEQVADELDVSVFGSTSVKAVLDLDWREPQARQEALRTLIEQFARLQDWLEAHFEASQLEQPPLCEHLETIERILDQDTEVDPDGPDPQARRIRDGVAVDRLISLSDRDMRHGRKSPTRGFDGYKRHIAVDADVPNLIFSVDLRPANAHEHEAAPALLAGAEQTGCELEELQTDRGYLPSDEIVERHEHGLRVITKPPKAPRTGFFSKDDFRFDFDNETLTCPAGTTIPLKAGKVLHFPKSSCQNCPLRAQCTTAAKRSITVHPQEEWFHQMAEELGTAEGREQRRERTAVEHTLARIGDIQGDRARFRGLEKNHFDLKRAAIINNCFVLNDLWQNAA